MNNPATISATIPEKLSTGMPLWRFMFGNALPRQYLAYAVGAIFIQFIIFKLLYPYPDFFSDSYSYLFGAYANLDINIWPIGYSKFLRAFHGLMYSGTSLVAFQYFFLQVSAMYLFFTIWFLFNLVRTNRIILFCFLFLNPLNLYISNYVNSDPVFAALSLCWFTQLLWIYHQPKNYHLLTHGLLLFFCFTIRNNAYYYPLISIVVHILSRQVAWKKLAGIAFPCLLIALFIIHSRNEAYKLTGKKQFSLFTGWQLANNALYFYEKINVDTAALPSEQLRELDRFAQGFFTHLPPEQEYRDYLNSYVGNFFIRQPRSPLKRYMAAHYQPKDELESVVAWGQSSAVFAEYGSYIIKHHPVEFAKYFMLLNTKNYFLPPLEKLEVYNLTEDSVAAIAAYWFHFPTKAVTSVSKTAQGTVLHFFPGFFLVINLYFAGALAIYLARKKYREQPRVFNLAILTGSLTLAANFAFCVFATILVFRY